MARFHFALNAALVGLAAAQTPGTVPDVHPKLTTYRCTANGCTEKTNYIVLDALAHPMVSVNEDYDCGAWGQVPNCPTQEACRDNCIMEGISDYSTVGVTTDGASIRMQQLLNGRTVSPRIYLLDETKERYDMTHLTGGEFSFDVDTTKLPCGMNSALYLGEMEEDGHKSALNAGGARWGTGYCDAQCYTTPFINGEANLEGYGACCNEMDIWEANSRASHIAPHPCNVPGVHLCEGDECGYDGICDENGCGWNPYRVNQTDYYGVGDDFDVDTSKPFTVVTQFPADPTTGKLASIIRLYIQDGVVIRSEVANKEGLPEIDHLNDEFCTAAGAERFMDLGGMTAMGDALTRGMVVTASIWWDEGGNMTWLDGASQGAGPCKDGEGNPSVIREVQPDPEVTFSNLKWGDINTTFTAVPFNRTRSLRNGRSILPTKLY
jgi:cellulase